MGFLGLLLNVGFRTVFSIVLTHVAHPNVSKTDDGMFLNCTTPGTSRDWQVDWSQETVYLMWVAYFVGSLITQIPGGILASRFSATRVCSLMILASSVMFIVLPFLAKVHSGYVFFIRTLQGLVEGGSVPALAGVVSAWAPKTERSRLLTIAYAGAYLSPAVGMITTGLCVCRVSWDSIFFIYGGLGVAWFVVWTIFVYENPDCHPNLSEEEKELFRQQGPRVRQGNSQVMRAIPWRSILTSLPVLAVFIGAFCRNLIFSMLITQQPQYFKDSFKFNIGEIGLLSAVPNVLMTVIVITGGVMVDKLITANMVGRTAGRKIAQTVGFGTEAICLGCLYFVSDWHTAMVLLCVGVGLSGFAISGYQVNPLDLSPQYAAVLTGIGRMGTVGSVVSTLAAAKLANNTMRRWQEIFLVAGIIHLVGVVLYDLMASGHVQPWDTPDAAQVIVNAQADPEGYVRPPQGGEFDPLLAPDKKKRELREAWERSLEDSLTLG